MGNLGRGKLYFGGTPQAIEDIAGKLRDKTLPRYMKKVEKEGNRWGRKDPDVYEWLLFTIDLLGGSTRLCDPTAVWSHNSHYCDSHGLITIKERGDFLIHNSAVMTRAYDNFTMGTALGFYFLHYDEVEKDVIFGWPDTKIAWSARRFSASLLMPEKEVFEYLSDKFNPNELTTHNYTDYVNCYLYFVAGRFQVSVDAVKIRLEHLFKKRAEEKEEIINEISSA